MSNPMIKKIAAIILALCCGSSFADPLPSIKIDAMVAQINAVMDSGLCAVANDTQDHGTEKIVVILRGGLKREILVNSYNYMRSAGYAKAADGQWLMAARARESCTADGAGEVCVAFSSYFSQFFPSQRAPGNGVRSRPL